MRALKVLAWIVGIVAVLVITGYITLRVMLPPEKLRVMVLPRLEQALGRRVEVGPIHLAIRGGFGIGIEDVRIGNRPGYGDEHMLVLDELILRIPLRPLLRRELEIRRIALVGPRVLIEKSTEGALNIAGVGRRLSPAEDKPEAVEAEPSHAPRPISLPIPITLQSFHIDHGSVRFLDRAAGLTAEVREIDYRASVSMDRSLRDVRVLGNLSAGEIRLVLPGLPENLPPFQVNISHRAKVDLAESILTLESVDVSVMGMEIGVKGTIEDFENPVLHLQTDVATNLADLPLGKDAQIAGTLASDIRVEGPALKPEDIRLLGTVEVDRLAFRSPEMPVPLENVAGSIVFKGEDVVIPNISGSFGSSPFSFSCDVARAVPFAATGGKIVPIIQFEFQCPHLVADEFIPEPLDTPDTSGEKGESSESVSPPIVPIPEIDARGTVFIEKITAKKLEANNLAATIEMAGNRLRIPEFSVDVYSGSIRGDAGADFRKLPEVPISWSVVAEDVEANDFVSAFTPFKDHLFGQLNLAARFGATGLTPAELRHSLTGSGHVSVARGRLVNWDLAKDLSKWIRFLEFEDIDFSDLDLDFEIADERVAMRPLKIKALDTRWRANGWAGFDETLDYQVTATLSKAATRAMQEKTSLANLITTDIGQAELMFYITGSARSPRFRWDTDSIQDQVRERGKDEIADILLKEVDKRLTGDAKDKARDLLTGVLKPDSTDTTGTEEKLEELKKEGEKLLKNLFGKKRD
ncbi:MAG: AsmA family protein [Candidatus Eisenbacteria sp.]|nr:AsmA family protein [Candidatus Eisenbacteria bacterium]